MTMVASYGGGVNSTAMLIGLHERGETVDLILFADTGGEKPETYTYLAKFSSWLIAHGFPEIRVVRKTTKRAGRFRGANEVLTLERMCLEQNILPSVAYGFKTCSLKFKREPQEEYLNDWIPAWAAWLRGESVIKLIGFDADEAYRAKESPNGGYRNRFPLIEWGWGRDECQEAIVRAGLCVPPKSSCFFCPNMEELEILELRDRHPDLLERALALEANAISTPNSTIKGLNRDLTWKQIVEYDAAQYAFIPRGRKTQPCECYDGG